MMVSSLLLYRERAPVVTKTLARHVGGCPLIDLCIEISTENADMWRDWIMRHKGPWEVFHVGTPTIKDPRRRIVWIIGEHDPVPNAQTLRARAEEVNHRRGRRGGGIAPHRQPRGGRKPKGGPCWRCGDLPHRRPEGRSCPVCGEMWEPEVLVFDPSAGLGSQGWV